MSPISQSHVPNPPTSPPQSQFQSPPHSLIPPSPSHSPIPQSPSPIPIPSSSLPSPSLHSPTLTPETPPPTKSPRPARDFDVDNFFPWAQATSTPTHSTPLKPKHSSTSQTFDFPIQPPSSFDMEAEFAAFLANTFDKALTPSVPIPEPSVQPSAQPSTSTSAPISMVSAAQYFTPIPTQLETKLDKVTLLLERISRQLTELQASQQEGFQELTFRHDTNEINTMNAEKEAIGDFTYHTRKLMNKVSRCFAHGGPHEPSVAERTKYEDSLYKEVRDAKDAATTAAKEEKTKRAPNICLLYEINDLCRQLNLSRYMNIPKDRDTFAEGQAEFEIEQRMKKVAAEEDERYQKEKERIDNMRHTSLFEDTDDEM